MAQPQLFASALPDGFDYRPDFQSPAGEQDLLAALRPLPFREFEFHGYTGKRRVLYFGWRYTFGGGGLQPADPLPDFLLPLRKRAADVAGLSPRALEQVLLTGYHQMIRHFDSHTELMAACGLEPRKKNTSVSDEALLEAMHEVFNTPEGLVPWHKFDRTYRHRHQVYKDRWGNWTGALRAYRGWVSERHPDFPHLAALSVACQGRGEGPAKMDGCGGEKLGAPFNRYGLQHAPTNEMDVVFLFGATAPSLGYLVETLGIAFPDCRAKRRLRGRDDVWERVRIEFEYRSRNFLSHKHDAQQCDLIVCWEHDWPDCPLEVLELRSALEPTSRHPSRLAPDGARTSG